MSVESKSVSGNILFKLFWWIALHINPEWASKIMYLGLRDGSFGRTTMRDPALAIKVWGHTFNTPIGIAGGVDKKGNVIDRLMQIGYGFGAFGPYTLEKELPEKQTHYFRKERSILSQSLGFRNPGLLKMLPWFVKRRYLPHKSSSNEAVSPARLCTSPDPALLPSRPVVPPAERLGS